MFTLGALPAFAIVAGLRAQRDIREARGALRGEEQAMAGVVLGAAGIVETLILLWIASRMDWSGLTYALF